MYISQGYQGKPNTEQAQENPKNVVNVSNKLTDNITYIQKSLGKNMGIYYRDFKIGKDGKRSASLVAIAGMVEVSLINISILQPLMSFDSTKIK
ncbi:hypothetical protein KHA80_21605 [Anaerobacillus sp. HL2]|nr:hypothetical protein KHA80_21605 [Anaerobacillus sp. HL2]